MTTVYTQYIYDNIAVGQTGHAHSKTGKADEPFALDCTVCEPFLVKEGWVYDPELVPLTVMQEREAERVEREGNLAVKQASAALATATVKAMTAPKRAGRKPKATAPKAVATKAVAAPKAAAAKADEGE